MKNDNLSHTSWKCKYHIVFAPKYRRQVVYNQIKADIGKILRQLCELKKVEIHAAEACPDHIHMLVSIPPNVSVSQIMGYLKGKSSLMIFDRHAKFEIQVWKPSFLVSRLLREYRGSGYSCNNRLYPKSVSGRSGAGANDIPGVYRPVYG